MSKQKTIYVILTVVLAVSFFQPRLGGMPLPRTPP